jgi:lysine 6-dehydrogenase
MTASVSERLDLQTDQTEKYTYAVLGAGRQGTAAAYDMAKFGQASKVTIGDVDLKQARHAANHVNRLIGRKIAQGTRVDVRRPAQIKRFLTGVDSILSAVPYYYNLEVAKAAIAARANMCDLGGHTGIVRKQLLLDRKATDAGISIIPDCGFGPGMAATVACYGMEKLDSTDEVYIWECGLPQNPRPPFNYLLTFNFEGLINEYSGKAVFLRDGEIVEVPCIEELEIIDFPSLGKLEALTTSGGTSTCPWTFKGKLKIFQNKTMRYPGTYAQLKTMRDLGLFSEKEIKVGGAKVAPRRVLQALYEPHVKLPGEKDVVALRVKCIGEKDDRPAEIVLELLDYYDDATQFTAMERTTGWSASIVAIMTAQGETPRGAKPLEIAVPGRPFVKELERRGIKLTEKTSWQGS